MGFYHKILPLLCLFMISQISADYRELSHKDRGSPARGDGHHSRGDGGHSHTPTPYNPAPTWDIWYEDWSRTPLYLPPPIEPHPYQPANPYRPLYLDERLPPDPPNYPSTTLYVPVFTLSTSTPMVYIGDAINISVDVTKGVPPYTVYWQYDQDAAWTEGTTTLSTTANKRGVISFTAVVKDLNGQVSLPQKIQIVVLRQQES